MDYIYESDAFIFVIGSVLCVGSEWHRYPSSFFIPSYISEVRWIDDGFRGLLPFPFNSTLGGTASAPPYFNNKNKASEEQYVNLLPLLFHTPFSEFLLSFCYYISLSVCCHSLGILKLVRSS